MISCIKKVLVNVVLFLALICTINYLSKIIIKHFIPFASIEWSLLNGQQGALGNLYAKFYSTELKQSSINFEDAYVSYSKTAFEGKELFIVFARITGNRYLGQKIGRYQRAVGNRTDGQNCDQFRHLGGAMYTFDGKRMIPENLPLLTNGENEAALSEVRGQIVGGIHGNEYLTSISFFINDEVITDSDLLAEFTLRPCKSFIYTQSSNIYRIGGTENVLVAKRFKTTALFNKGFETTNRFIFPKDLTLSALYLNVACITKQAADIATNELGETRVLLNKGTSEMHFLADTGGHRLNYQKINIGSSVSVYGECTSDKELDKVFIVTVKDNRKYSKYYRTAYNISFRANEFVEGRTKVVFNFINMATTR